MHDPGVISLQTRWSEVRGCPETLTSGRRNDCRIVRYNPEGLVSVGFSDNALVSEKHHVPVVTIGRVWQERRFLDMSCSAGELSHLRFQKNIPVGIIFKY